MWGGIWLIRLDPDDRIAELRFFANSTTRDGIIYDFIQLPTGEFLEPSPETRAILEADKEAHRSDPDPAE